MTGEFVVVEHKTLSGVASTTFNIGTTRNEYAMTLRGMFSGGAVGESLFARLNGDTGANYESMFHNQFDDGTHSVARADQGGIQTSHHASGNRNRMSLHLSRAGSGWLYHVEFLEQTSATNVLLATTVRGRWTFDVAINSIVMSFSGGAGAGRFTGDVTLFGKV